jgi:hypothetical protein
VSAQVCSWTWRLIPVIESRYTGSQGAEDVLVSALESIEHQTSVIGSRHEFSDGVGGT